MGARSSKHTVDPTKDPALLIYILPFIEAFNVVFLEKEAGHNGEEIIASETFSRQGIFFDETLMLHVNYPRFSISEEGLGLIEQVRVKSKGIFKNIATKSYLELRKAFFEQECKPNKIIWDNFDVFYSPADNIFWHRWQRLHYSA